MGIRFQDFVKSGRLRLLSETIVAFSVKCPAIHPV